MFNRYLKAIFTVVAAALALPSPPAHAVPSFARQTGQACGSCHTVFPELTAFGRQFKLRGYTLGNGLDGKEFPYNLPLSASLIASRTTVKDKRAIDTTEEFKRTGETMIQTAAVYYGGKITQKSGAFVQYNYDGVERRFNIEMADIRYVNSASVRDKELLWGVTLNNGPTTQDVWNAAPMWSFPHLADATELMSSANPLLDMGLARKAGGIGLYGFWDNTLYAELSFYRTTRRGVMSPLSAGVPTDTVIDGNAPYWHVMYNREMHPHNFAVGAHGMTTDVLRVAADPGSPTDRYRDVSLDAQYQYLGDDHIFTADATWTREKREWNASFPAGTASNPSGLLRAAKMNVHYWYQRRVGGGIGRFTTWGDSDMLKYGMSDEAKAMGNATGSPDTRGWTVELNYLPLKDVQTLKLGLRYTHYDKFNGAKSDYNGFGRDAADNNTTFLYAWLLF